MSLLFQGTNFCNAVNVYFNNAPTWFQVNSSTNISTVVPAGTGTVDIRIVAPGGVSQVNASDKFSYGAISPTTNRIISLSGNLTFGNQTVGTTRYSTLTISNAGNATLTVSGSGISYPTGFSGNWTGTIPPGGSQNVTVAFAPTAAQSYGGTVAVNSDATSGTATISVSGTGVSAAANATRIIDVVAQTDLAFGNVQANTVASRVVTIFNEGNTNLDITSIAYPPGFSGNLSATILPGNYRAIAVYFAPTALTNYTGTMTVNSDATSGVNTLAISGTGVSPPPPSTNRIAVSAFVTLHSFSNYDGNQPQAPLVLGTDGGFYGTTVGGGTSGAGTIFRIASDGTFSSLFGFTNQNSVNGTRPMAGLVQGTDGNFYGTTSAGAWGAGTVFNITPYGSLTLLATFYVTNGDAPFGALVQGSDGNFYGTAETGGANPGSGTIFRITPQGHLTTLYEFTNGLDGSLPYAGLLEASDGNFYGTTPYAGTWGNGTIFRITTEGSFTSLCSFNGTNGSGPLDALIQGNDGNFYGTTVVGGTWGNGTIFRMTTNSILSNLYSFTGGGDGSRPYGALVQSADGNFYGTTSSGGALGYGTIFQTTPVGAFTTLHSFQGGNEGRKPLAGMVQGQDGNLYGTTSLGGTENDGTIFRLVIPATIQSAVQLGSTFTLTWTSIVGQTYQVQWSSDLTSSNWTNLTPVITAIGSTTTVSDNSTPSQQRYYRIVLFPEAW